MSTSAAIAQNEQLVANSEQRTAGDKEALLSYALLAIR